MCSLSCARLILSLSPVFGVLTLAVAEESHPTIPTDTTVEGKVVAVADGDTLTVLIDKTQHRIRLASIDAPEKGQPFGTKAREVLGEKVFGKIVKVLSQGADRYGRTIGVVCAASCVNTAMVQEGFAWHYVAYSDSELLAQAEKEARAARAGLWSDPNPIPPWEWRRKGRERSPPSGESESSDREDNRRESSNQKYWLTTSSGVRHNSSCRWYEKSKGRPCGPNEGKACKICGG